MKKLILIMLLLLTSCTTTKLVEVPVEVVKKEYVDRVLHDSIYIEKNTDTNIRNDTVFKTLYIYKYIQKTDTLVVIKHDSIPKPIKVETIKEINKLKNWQVVLMIMGGGFIVLLLSKLRRIL